MILSITGKIWLVIEMAKGMKFVFHFLNPMRRSIKASR